MLEVQVGYGKPLSGGSLEQWLTGLTAVEFYKLKLRVYKEDHSFYSRPVVFPNYELQILAIESCIFFHTPLKRVL